MILDNINNYKPINSRVLVKIDKHFTDVINITTSEGVVDIKIDTSFEPEKHTITYGTIAAVPDQLVYGERDFHMAWKTPMEVSVGDKVYFSWEAVAVAFGKTSDVIVVKNESGFDLFVSVRYAQLTLKKCRNSGYEDYIHMLNGYCLIREIGETELPDALKSKDLKSSFIIAPGTRRAKASGKYGIVELAGACNEEYINPNHYDDPSISTGNLVMFDPNSNVLVQYDLHAELIGKQKLFKIQRRYLLAKIEL